MRLRKIEDEQRQRQDMLFQQQQADRARNQTIQDEQQAGQRASLLQMQIARLAQAGQGQTAAGMLPEYFRNFNQAAHTNLSGPSILGTTITDQVAGQPLKRPAPNFQGPMPIATETKTRQDFNTPATLTSILGAIGAEPPKPELVKIGRSVGHYDRNGKFIVDHTEPDPLEDYRAETLDLRRQQLADQAEARRQAAADRREAAADRRAGRTEKAGKIPTETIVANGRVLLINKATGATIRDLGAATQRTKPGGDDEIDLGDPETPAASTPAVPITYGSLPLVDLRHPANQKKPAKKPPAKKPAPKPFNKDSFLK